MESIPSQLSVVHGLPLAGEPGVDALTIPGYLREITRRFAMREALAMPSKDGMRRWTYEQLWRESLAVAKALIASGLGKNARVGILMTNRLEFLATFFGTAMAGAVPVVLSTFSTRPELEQLLKMSDCSVLLFEGSVLKKDFAAMLEEIEPGLGSDDTSSLCSQALPYLRQLVQLEQAVANSNSAARWNKSAQSWYDFIEAGSSVPDELVDARTASVQPCDIGGLFFSSGTTSLPKGILHSQRAFALQWWRGPKLAGISEAVVSMPANGFFWAGNMAMVPGLTFTLGGKMVLQPYFEPEQALRLIELERISFLQGRPHQWARLQKAVNWSSVDLASLRYVTRGELMWQHPTVNTDWHIPMGYGNTETLSISTSNAFNEPPEEPKGCFGTPLPGNILKIADPDTNEPVRQGESGEVCIKGPTLMLGYLGKTIEQSFDSDGYFRTGDGGHVDGRGRLFWEGRINEIIKTGGANVSPVEIDELICNYPGVRRAHTVGLPHETMGEVVVSCIVTTSGEPIGERALMSYLAERLASYKLPKQIEFFSEEELEVTGSGKVKVAQLRSILADRATKYAAN